MYKNIYQELNQEIINAQKEKITRIVGDITQEGINNIEGKNSVILVSIKSYHFKEGRTNRHLSVIIPMEEYCTIIGNNTWMYDPPVDINAYNPTTNNATAAVQVIKEAE